MKYISTGDMKTMNRGRALMDRLCSKLFPLGQLIVSIPLLFASIANAAWVQTHCPANGNILSFATNGSNLLVGISNGGIYLTTDNGTTWSEADNGLPVNTTVNALLAYGSDIFAGTYGNGIYLSSSGSTWAASNTGLPVNATVNALLAYGSNIFAGTYGNGVYLSANSGASWTAANNGLPGSAIVNAMTATGTSLFIATQSGIYRSSNNGATWTAANYGIPTGTIVETIIASGTLLYAGTNGSGIYYSSDNGSTWTASSNGLQGNTNILSMAANGSDILVGTVGGVFHNDSGSTWQPVNSGLSSTYSVYAIGIDGNNVFAGTSNGVWESVLPPPTPSYFSPANSATNQPDSLTLTWSSISSATSYAVQISTDSTFATSIVSNASGLTTNSYTVSGLANNTVYYWHVSATNDGGTSAWSSVNKFTTTILSPTPTSPVNNSTNEPVSLTLSWNTIPTASSYGLQVSQDSTFASSIVFSQSGLTSTSQVVSGLTNSTVYFWRVNATNTGGTSAWSRCSRFSTIVALPASPIPVLPASNAVGQPVSLLIGWYGVSSAISYSLQVSTDSTFASSVVYSQNNLTTTSQTINGLSNSTVYYWHVSATNMVGTGPWSATSRFSTVVGIPTLVSPVNNPVNQPVSLTFTWGAVASATAYSLQVSTDSTFSGAPFYSQSGLSATAQTVSGLANNTTYFWRVNATNAGGTGAWSAVNRFSTVIALPTSPVLVSPLSKSTNQPISLALSWNASASAISYALQVSTDSTFATSIVYSQTGLTATSQTINGLANHTTYYWHVNATNQAGSSAWSLLSSFTTLISAPTLESPANTATGQPLTISLQWDPVATATSYTLQLSTDSTFVAQSFVNQSGLTAASQSVPGLSNNTVYYWRVSATNSGGTSQWSSTYHFTTTLACPTLVSPSNKATNQPISNALSWNAVPTATSYSLQVSTDSTFVSSLAYSQNGITATSQTVSGLANNTVYYWRVNAANTGSTSVWSACNSFKTVLLPPTLVSPANAATGQSTTLALAWNPVASATSYALQISTTAAFTTLAYNQSGLTSTTQVASGLANNTTYYWRVNATNAGSTSAWSTTNQFATVIAASSIPTLLTPVNNAAGQPVSLTLTWNGVAGATSYGLQVSSDSTFTNLFVYNQNGLTTASHALSGLTNYTTYYWHVNATNAGGTSAWSATYRFTTIDLAPTPVSPTANSVNQPLSLTLSWTSVGTATYALQVSADSIFSTKIAFSQSGLTSTSQAVGNLFNSTKYYWRVNASDANGTSPWSTKDSFTTIIAAPAAPILASPVNAAVSQPVSLTLSWSAVTGATTYGLQVSTDSTFATSVIYNQNGLTAKSQAISGLTNNTVYYWRVNATSFAGTSAWSNTYGFATAVPAPTPVSPLANALNQPVSLTMSWNAVASATSYGLQVSTDSTFKTALAVNLNGLTSTTQAVGGLTNNKVYYWRVNGSNTNGTSVWSATNKFTTIFLPPALSSPASGATNQPGGSLKFTWGIVTSAISYGLQISTDSTFATLVIYSQTGITTTSQTVSGLANLTTYYWRVNASNASGGISAWSNANHFVTANSAPVPISPVSAVLQSATFQWNPVTGTSSYALQVSTDSTFAKNVIFNQGGITTTSQVVSNLASGTVYYWRVNATNTNGTSPWSATNSFTTIGAPPALVSPVNNASNVVITPTLSWNAVTSATAYALQVSPDSTFGASNKIMFNVATTTQSVTGLNNNAVYYWRVDAINAGGTSAWSAKYRFTTVIAPPASPVLNGTSGGSTISLILKWDTVANATSYTLQISTDSLFGSFVYNQSGLTATSTTVSSLAGNAVYYWRVNATNAGGTSAWSQTNFFKVQAQPADVKSRMHARMPTAFALGDAQWGVAGAGITIPYAVPEASNGAQSQQVRIRLYDMQGHRVATLVDEWVPAGYHSVQFGGKNSAGQIISRGSCICKMEASNFINSKLLMIVR